LFTKLKINFFKSYNNSEIKKSFISKIKLKNSRTSSGTAAVSHLYNSSIFALVIDGSQYFFVTSSGIELQEVTNMKINAMINKEFFIFCGRIRLNTESEQRNSTIYTFKNFKNKSIIKNSINVFKQKNFKSTNQNELNN